MMNKKHNIIDKTQCTHFEIAKLCAFIFAIFKNERDCIIIENPLNESIPEVKTMEILFGENESVFEPLVTSNIP